MKIKTAFLLYILLFLSGIVVHAQNSVTGITKIQQKDSIVEITITSSVHFYTGANPYVLHIGNSVFMRSKEPENAEGKALVFFIPITEFRELNTGDDVTLVYGYYQENIESANRQGKDFAGKHWQLGQLNKIAEEK